MIIHIIGCGTIGSRLAIKLCEQRIVSELHLYDNDIVTKRDPPIFLKNSIGSHKCQIVSKNISLMLGSIKTIKLFVYNNKIVRNVGYGDLVIDCRDKKETYLKAHLRISYDGNYLMIDADTTNKTRYENIFPEYFFKKKSYLIDLAISIICNFIVNKMWRKKYRKNNSLFYYDLNKIIRGKAVRFDDNKD